MKKLLLAVLVVGFAISSCSIEKRLHQKGFNVEWNKNLGSLKKDKKEKQDYVSSEAVEEIAVVSNKTTKAPSVNNNSAISVDGVTLNESNDASVFVEDITTNEVNSEVSSVVNNTKTEKVNEKSKNYLNINPIENIDKMDMKDLKDSFDFKICCG